jgi:hypothetical protein
MMAGIFLPQRLNGWRGLLNTFILKGFKRVSVSHRRTHRVAENGTASLKTELPPHLGGECVTEPVRSPAINPRSITCGMNGLGI